MLFLAAADRALLCTLTMFPFVDVHHSGDDPARFCNVESIQDNFRYPAVDLRAANGYYYYLGRCIYQRWYDPRRYGFSSIGSPNGILGNTATDSFLFPVSVDQVFNFKSCDYSSSTEPPATYRAIPRFVLGGTLLILAVIPPLRQSVEMYKVTKRFQTNRTMELLVREGAVYFVVYVSLLSFLIFLIARTFSLDLGTCFSISSTRSIFPSSISCCSWTRLVIRSAVL